MAVRSAKGVGNHHRETVGDASADTRLHLRCERTDEALQRTGGPTRSERW